MFQIHLLRSGPISNRLPIKRRVSSVKDFGEGQSAVSSNISSILHPQSSYKMRRPSTWRPGAISGSSEDRGARTHGVRGTALVVMRENRTLDFSAGMFVQNAGTEDFLCYSQQRLQLTVTSVRTWTWATKPVNPHQPHRAALVDLDFKRLKTALNFTEIHFIFSLWSSF